MRTNLFAVLLAIAFVFTLASCNNGKGKPNLKEKSDTIAYVIGTNIGKNLKENIERDSLKLGNEALIQGFKDALAGLDSSVFTEAQKQQIMMDFQKEMQKKQMDKAAKMAEPNKQEGQKFLADNKTKPGVKELPDGLQYKVIKEGAGKTPKETDKVTVNYEGRLISGKIFDSSFETKKPATFPVNGVIKGWTEALQLMKEGGSYELYIPSDLAYGDAGNRDIPGGSTLIFKVELIKIENAETQPKDQSKPKEQKKTK
jgi:FKBP-type peptidyl-prolyl cis-trans isomerase FklB